MFIDDLQRLDKSLIEVWEKDHTVDFPLFLDNKRPIRLIGMGASYNVCVAAAPLFSRYGIRVQVSLASDVLHFGLPAIQDHECLVLVSQGGESAETVKLARLLKEKRHPHVLAITNKSNSTLASLATAVCNMQSYPDTLVSLATYNSTYIVLYKLALKLANVKFPDLASTFEEASRLVANGMEMTQPIIQEIQSPTMIDLLGRGPMFGAALEACVIFREVSKLTTCAWDTGEYRHGAIESMHQGQITFLFSGVSEHTKQLDSAIAKRLRTIPGRVIQVGTSDGADFPIGAVDEDMRPILDLIPIYFLANQWALNRGIVPGTFFYAAHVTKEES